MTNTHLKFIKKQSVEIVETTCGLMINDMYSFIYLRSEGLSELKRHSLGGGNFLMIIGQFAILNYLSKIYSILCEGETVYVTQKDIDIFESTRSDVRKSHKEVWKKVSQYTKKPRKWDFINETRAFTKLIIDYPDDMGIPKKPESIQKVWNDFRNKLSHIATIGNNNMSLTFEFPEEQKTFALAKEFLATSKGKPFIISSKEEKEKMEKEIFEANNKKGEPTNTSVVWKITADKLIPDLFCRDIHNIVQWITNKISNNEFEDEKVKTLYTWLLMQHYVTR